MIKFKNVSFKYDKEFILKNLNINIKKGDYCLVVGSNGSGKTTFLKCLLRQLNPCFGTIEIEKDVKFGYLSQVQSITNDLCANVYEIVESGLIVDKLFINSLDKEKIDNALKNLDIFNLKYEKISNLSIGQRQRVLLARAIVSGIDVLVLDEPTNALDVFSSNKLYEIIKDLNNLGITIIMVTHDMHDCKKYCNKIIDLGDKLCN